MRTLRRRNRQTTPTALAMTARQGSLDDARLMTFVDLRGNVVGVLTQPEVYSRPPSPKPIAPLGIISRPHINR